MLAERVEALLAEKGCDADVIRDTLARADVEAGIPAKSNRPTPIPHDREKYRRRYLIECLSNKLKNRRHIATRYVETADFYLGFVTLASVGLWPLCLVSDDGKRFRSQETARRFSSPGFSSGR